MYCQPCLKREDSFCWCFCPGCEPEDPWAARRSACSAHDAAAVRKAFTGWQSDWQLTVWLRVRNWQRKGKGKAKGTGKQRPIPTVPTPPENGPLEVGSEEWRRRFARWAPGAEADVAHPSGHLRMPRDLVSANDRQANLETRVESIEEPVEEFTHTQLAGELQNLLAAAEQAARDLVYDRRASLESSLENRLELQALQTATEHDANDLVSASVEEAILEHSWEETAGWEVLFDEEDLV